jgi:hypothetical protein
VLGPPSPALHSLNGLSGCSPCCTSYLYVRHVACICIRDERTNGSFVDERRQRETRSEREFEREQRGQRASGERGQPPRPPRPRGAKTKPNSNKSGGSTATGDVGAGSARLSHTAAHAYISPFKITTSWAKGEKGRPARMPHPRTLDHRCCHTAASGSAHTTAVRSRIPSAVRAAHLWSPSLCCSSRRRKSPSSSW